MVRRLLLCGGCLAKRRGRHNRDPEQLPFTWVAVSGRGRRLPSAPCCQCGQPVIRNDDPLLLRTLCSHACATAYRRRLRSDGTVRTGEGAPHADVGAPGAGVVRGEPGGADRVQVKVRLERALFRRAVSAAMARDQALGRYLEYLIALDTTGDDRWGRYSTSAGRDPDPADPGR